jgi:hypothetical protein
MPPALRTGGGPFLTAAGRFLWSSRVGEFARSLGPWRLVREDRIACNATGSDGARSAHRQSASRSPGYGVVRSMRAIFRDGRTFNVDRRFHHRGLLAVNEKRLHTDIERLERLRESATIDMRERLRSRRTASQSQRAHEQPSCHQVATECARWLARAVDGRRATRDPGPGCVRQCRPNCLNRPPLSPGSLTSRSVQAETPCRGSAVGAQPGRIGAESGARQNRERPRSQRFMARSARSARLASLARPAMIFTTGS